MKPILSVAVLFLSGFVLMGDEPKPDAAKAKATGKADCSPLAGRAAITLFNDHLSDSEAIVERLLPFDVVCLMRERTPLPRSVFPDGIGLPSLRETCRDAPMAKLWRLLDVYRFPGFVPRPKVRGIFGDAWAVVISLHRRRKNSAPRD